MAIYFFGVVISIQQSLTTLVEYIIIPPLPHDFGTTVFTKITQVATSREWQGISLTFHCPSCTNSILDVDISVTHYNPPLEVP